MLENVPIIDDVMSDTSGSLNRPKPSLLSQAQLVSPIGAVGAKLVTPARYLRGLAVLRSQEALEGPRARLDLALLGLRSFV
jgi:hypothetical protein